MGFFANICTFTASYWIYKNYADRGVISSVAVTAGFDLDGAEDIKTAVSEACKLVSCHGFDGFSDKYELQCSVEEGRIEIIIEDRCENHTLEKLHKPCKNCPTEGNIGVYVIQTLMNEVEINVLENGQKSIKMVKYL